MSTSVEIGYAWGQLQRARVRAVDYPDAEVRARALKRIAQWQQVIAGMRSGALAIGSRVPTEAPAWVTLEVVHGGFATGGHAAGGPLLAHELAWLARLGKAGVTDVAQARRTLNLAALGGDELAAMLASGHYRIDVPEEGALLVAAWLFAHGDAAAAEALIDELAPWFGVLRFYPRPADHALDETGAVHRHDVATTLSALSATPAQPHIETMHETLHVWTPLYARFVAIALDLDAPDFADRARALLDEYAELRAVHRHSGSPDGAKSYFGQLRARVAEVVAGRASAATLRRIRHITTAYVMRHGEPFGTSWQSRHERKLRAVAAPLHRELRAIAIERLRALPADGGIVAFAAMAGAVRAAEASRTVPAGTALPAAVHRKLEQSREASPEVLVERGVIGSSEVLAQVLPQITSAVRADGIADPALRRLDRAIYAAFRRRRSLLLVHYVHQVRLEELPWLRPLDAGRRLADTAEVARQTLGRTLALALTGFPATITPNKLVTELVALAKAARLELPIVEEIAADIFMGGFTPKFGAAAQAAARLLEGTLYARYYAIASPGVAGARSTPEGSAESIDGADARDFAVRCRERAGVATTRHRSVVQNGQVLEQCQILTTHNLAVAFATFPLAQTLDLRGLAEATLLWVVRQLRMPVTGYVPQLRRLKNVAYAWRQLVFYLSFGADVASFAAWARTQAGTERLAPALRGLELAANGVRSDAAEFTERRGRVLTGWTAEPHWLAQHA